MTTGRIADEAQRPDILAALAQAFNARDHQLSRLRAAPIEQFWVIGTGRVEAALRLVPTAQWFGGRSVRSEAVTAVVVRPESRGNQMVQELLRDSLRAAREAGYPLSVLYPSTLPTYRRAGYELAGARTRYRVPISALRGRSGGTVDSWADKELASVMECYQRYAPRWNGLIDRSETWWREYVTAAPHDGALYRYAVNRNGSVSGYLLYTEETEHHPVLPLQHLRLRELIWTDGESRESLLAFMGAHSVLGVDASWYGPTPEPLSAAVGVPLLPDVTYYWMLRLLDVRAALEGRGYPPDVSGELKISVRDPIVEDNQRDFSLTVTRGAAEVRDVQGAHLRLDVGALGAIYSGWMSARSFAALGRLEGATESDLRTFDRLFRDGTPWLAEWF